MYYLCSENKGADQLCAVLRLCFLILKKKRFSYNGAHLCLTCSETMKAEYFMTSRLLCI